MDKTPREPPTLLDCHPWTGRVPSLEVSNEGHRKEREKAALSCSFCLQFQSFIVDERAAMAATAVSAFVGTPAVALSSTVERSAFVGASVQGLPALRISKSARPLAVVASTKKVNVKQPLGE